MVNALGSAFSSRGVLTAADIYGPIKKVAKSASYAVHGPGNLIGIRDKRDYAKKKKIFQQGFSDAALRKHEPTMIGQIDIFCRLLLENESGKPVKQGEWTESRDMNSWCMFGRVPNFCKC